MSSGIHFDNIYVGNDVAAAAECRAKRRVNAREKALKAAEAAGAERRGRSF